MDAEEVNNLNNKKSPRHPPLLNKKTAAPPADVVDAQQALEEVIISTAITNNINTITKALAKIPTVSTSNIIITIIINSTITITTSRTTVTLSSQLLWN